MYDIKRFLVEPIIEDINISTNFNISYKIEKENGKYTLIFCLKNIKIDEIINNVIEIFDRYAFIISNTAYAFE